MTNQIPREDVERLRALADHLGKARQLGNYDPVWPEWAATLQRVLSRIEELEGQLARANELATAADAITIDDEHGTIAVAASELREIDAARRAFDRACVPASYRQARQENEGGGE